MSEFKGFDDWIPIFQGGRQVDSNGVGHDGDTLIDTAVSTFNAARHEPPVVVGHPKENGPAFGWVEGLKRQGDTLLAKFKQVEPAFADMVKRGLFKKRSAAFYPDGSLRHVGFLGAAPPAVKGLPDVAFADADAMTFEFVDEAERWGWKNISDAFRRLREWLIEKFDADTADKVITNWQIDDLASLSKAPETPVALTYAERDREKAQKAQESRSKKYGIAVKDGGHVTKPGKWESVPDEDFLDPANYRYPCPDAEQTQSAASYWGQEKNKAQYSTEERSIIDKRLVKFEKKFNIGEYRKEEKMKFNEFVQKLKELMAGVEPEASPAAGTFSESDLKAAAEKAAEAAKKTERENVAAEFAEKERVARQDARKKEISSWCEQMVKAGKITPAMVKFGMPEFMAAFAEKEDVIEFGEAKEKATLYDRFKTFFETELPKVVEFKEVATRDKDTGGLGQAGSKVEALIQAKMKENKELTYSAAFAETQRENLDLAREYQQEIGG